MKLPLSAFVALLLSAIAASAQEAGWPYPTLDGQAPIVIAHRGASGYFPEHTLPAYALAADLGADYIEPDLVVTKDGHLVARHDRYLSTTTDVAEREAFAGRRKTVEGRSDWYVEDFTLAELKTLRARQPFAGRPDSLDGRFEIPTLEEVIALAKAKSAELGREIGLYPETKHPTYHRAAGLDFVPRLLDVFNRTGYLSGGKIFVQSFEPEILRRLDAETDLPLVMLVFPQREIDGTSAPDVPNIALETAAAFADGIGPHKALLISPRGGDSGFVARAHALGLAVHPWTVRDDRTPALIVSARQEYRLLYGLGVDGLFTDFPDSGAAMRSVIAAAARWVRRE